MQEEIMNDDNSPHMQEKINTINDIINSDKIDPTMSLNILINAIQGVYDKEDIFNDLDKFLISKALLCFKDKVESGENFEIIVK